MSEAGTLPLSDRSWWRDRRVVVVGAGVSGVAVARLLHELGARVTVNDARDEDDIEGREGLHDLGIALLTGGHPDDLWRSVEVAVFSPGIRPDAPVTAAARAAGVPIVAEIDVPGSLVAAPIVAITGSNGKSTVTSMLGAIYAAAGLDAPVCGNIGTALSKAARAELIESTPPDAYIVEVSSFQAHGIERLRPRRAAILNLQPDHIDWHGSMDAYAGAKLRLLRNMGAGDSIVYDRDDAEVVARLPETAAARVPFSIAAPPDDGPAAWVDEGTIRWRGEAGATIDLMATDELAVIGPHNHANACAAAALAMLSGIAPPSIRSGLAGYHALEHRMEPCGEINGVRCINDSKATNVDATLAALSGFAAGVWLILGGRDKGADFRRLLPLLDDRIAGILLIGEARETIAATLEPTHRVQRCETLERAFDRALVSAVAGDILLLSPACTSFDQYPDFEARGRHFKRLVAARGAAPSDDPEPLTEAP